MQLLPDRRCCDPLPHGRARSSYSCCHNAIPCLGWRCPKTSSEKTLFSCINQRTVLYPTHKVTTDKVTLGEACAKFTSSKFQPQSSSHNECHGVCSCTHLFHSWLLQILGGRCKSNCSVLFCRLHHCHRGLYCTDLNLSRNKAECNSRSKETPGFKLPHNNLYPEGAQEIRAFRKSYLPTSVIEPELHLQEEITGKRTVTKWSCWLLKLSLRKRGVSGCV